MKKTLYILIFLYFCFLESVGQQLPIYRQYFFNPAVMNPAYNGIDNYTELNLFYRQQWLGVQDAPRSYGFNFQYPTRKRLFFAMDFYGEDVVAVNTSSLTVSFGYSIPLSANQSLRFALSGGVGLNQLNLNENELNSSDIIILSALDNNMFLDGRFGVAYQHGNFTLGFSLPKLLESEPFTNQQFNEVEFSELDNRIFYSSYKLFLSEKVSLEPHVIFLQNAAFNEFGGALAVNYNNVIWGGANYQNSVGWFLGLQFNNVMVQYNYENAAFSIGGALNETSHGVQLSLRFGQNKSSTSQRFVSMDQDKSNSMREDVNEKKIDESSSTILEDEQEKSNLQTVEKEAQTLSPSQSFNQPVKDKAERQEPLKEDNLREAQEPETGESLNNPLTVSRVEDDEDLTKLYRNIDVSSPDFDNGINSEVSPMVKGFYVVVGVFAVKNNASRFIKALENDGYEGSYFFDSTKGYNYVFLYYNKDNRLEASEVRDIFRTKQGFENAWLLKVE